MNSQPSPLLRKHRPAPRDSACVLAVETWVEAFDEDASGDFAEWGRQLDLGGISGRQGFAFDDE